MQTIKQICESVLTDNDEDRLTKSQTIKAYLENYTLSKKQIIKGIKREKYNKFLKVIKTPINDFGHTLLGYLLLLYLIVVMVLISSIPVVCFDIKISTLLSCFTLLLGTPTLVINGTSNLQYRKDYNLLNKTFKELETDSTVKEKSNPVLEISKPEEKSETELYDSILANIDAISKLKYDGYEDDVLLLYDLADKIITGFNSSNIDGAIAVLRTIQNKIQTQTPKELETLQVEIDTPKENQSQEEIAPKKMQFKPVANYRRRKRA